jgi:hypothetical protein
MRIRLELDDSDPPVGTASRARATVTFIGWLELLSAIRLLLEGRATGVPDDQRSKSRKGFEES